jgi:hypothetical protein
MTSGWFPYCPIASSAGSWRLDDQRMRPVHVARVAWGDSARTAAYVLAGAASCCRSCVCPTRAPLAGLASGRRDMQSDGRVGAMPPWVLPIVSGGVAAFTGILGLIRYRMRLKFCLRIYEARKSRNNLEVAGLVSASAWRAIFIRHKGNLLNLDRQNQAPRSRTRA